ncbi:Asp-tRNA(Asn)/Glu-tRNA(Gln) amidotransferase subunit GatA [Patescibacteria group bacterium]|nr:Asp-tRNA(Asn)/Glu-tRNA(Gln) amidotransferase subunit GatA [Patescibacteria group bacterium]MBU1663407.1 Asp-tRNA(Asn)/Glu-tRNA(Gln) amidotransferase subunit GatA [Patescibacteria group bacterium]MBU1933895.1 Asp-tRNA(Asn)/Glu-tRNA(Gln) amidotransferase subunit GatA [Patescibacteria group bacterium]MBU2007712.1 Asp-tRNA(Asn)/Glu-tRNA(Gln) amidotransferase subunit GatA [Patescibacteria group bacterium]MBU2263719.1 Asp-tRNA(Asn)/Glu-tRNA(Gln) amidotransferase subunit GatA [Patescibacteria group
MSKSELNKLTIKQAIEKLNNKEITSVELTAACLARIKSVNGKINACLTVCEEQALVEAKKADEIRQAGQGQAMSLLGIPYLAKDNIMTKNIKTTAGSKILENYIACYDAVIIKKLKQAGAVLLGKTNMDEFAHGSSTENSAFGTTHNPWDLSCVPGGSSGGSAAAVATDMCLFALGTDTGGSIRHPAGFCGITGLKPTYGRSSRFGLISMTSSTDVPGPLTKTVEDAMLVLQVIEGVDKNDATTVEITPSTPLCQGENLKGLTVGLPKEYFIEGIEKGVKQAIEQAIEEFKKLGVRFVEVSLPHTKYGVPVYYIITPSEISSNLARFDGIKYGLSVMDEKNHIHSLFDIYAKSRGKGFGPEAKRRIMLGTYALSAGYYDAYYIQAQKVRTKIKQEMDKVLGQVNCLLTPTAPHVAFKIGSKSADPLKMYLEDIFVTGASLSGLPAISIPCGFDHSLPVGLQLIGKKFDEAMLFRIGHNYQTATEWHLKRAKSFY